jgi:hypothetical protein
MLCADSLKQMVRPMQQDVPPYCSNYFLSHFFVFCLIGRGMWETDNETLDKLRNLYSDADDLIEQVASSFG